MGLYDSNFAPRKTQNVRPEANAWGGHDKLGFYGHDDKLPVRCFNCNNLFQQDFFDEGRTPCCKMDISRKELQRDMYVEAYTVKVNVKGWTREALEDLSKCDYPAVWSPGLGVTRPVDTVSRNMAAMAVSKQRAIQKLRQMSSVSQAFKMGFTK